MSTKKLLYYIFSSHAKYLATKKTKLKIISNVVLPPFYTSITGKISNFVLHIHHSSIHLPMNTHWLSVES